MFTLTAATEVILQYQDKFLDKRVLVAGDMQDLLPAQLEVLSMRIHTVWFHRQQTIAKVLGEQVVQFSLVANSVLANDCDTLIYFWPKNKSEALFQITNLLSLMPLGCDIFIVGENRSGVRSAKSMLDMWCPLDKIGSIRRCSLYHGLLIHQPNFDIETYWQSYLLNDIVIKTLPGVFSRKRLDNGSRLLLSTFKHSIQGNIADIGCGAGVLSAVLAKGLAGVQLTLSDVHAPALVASRATLVANGLQGDIVASDVYSSIRGNFDIIIANPPFHDGMKTNLKMTETLIRNAIHHLRIGGELRIVVNAFLSYSDLLNEVFGNHQVLTQNNRFKVYQAFH